MISVVIPTLNAEARLGATLSALVSAAVDGLVREVIVVDGGSTDGTLAIAHECGTEILKTGPGRGHQLMLGAKRARFPWLLFLHADTVLARGWEHEATTFIESIEAGHRAPGAAAFNFRLDDLGVAPRWLEQIVRMRSSVFKLPYGDQGLLIPRTLYDETGGYRALDLMEDLDFIRRLSRRQIATFAADARTSAERYRRDGYLRRILRNQACLALYLVGAPMSVIVRLYERRPGPGPHAPLEAGAKRETLT